MIQHQRIFEIIMALITDPYSVQRIAEKQCKNCCGPIVYLLDKCDGSVPWKCYYGVRNPLGSATVNRNHSSWSMSGARMRPPDYVTSGGATEAEGFFFKMKSYPPPWTFEVAVRFYNLELATGVANSEQFRVRFFQRTQVAGFGFTSPWTRYYDITPGSIGMNPPDGFHQNVKTANNTFDPAGQEVYLKATLATDLTYTYDMKVDGAHPTYQANSSGNVVTLPVVGTITESVANIFTSAPYWPVFFYMRRGGWIDYLEARVKPSI